jgi:hypothetical protein
MNSIALRVPLALCALFVALTGCSGADSNGDVSASSAASALSSESARIVAVQSNSSGAGYVVRELNCSSPQHVDSLDLTAASVDTSSLTSALHIAGAVALRGRLDGATFVATDVYRALPDTAASPRESFFLAERGTNGSTKATVVNESLTSTFDRLDVSGAAVPFLDQTWLTARVLAAGALVAGSLQGAGGAVVLRASEVLVRVPEEVACPAPLFIECAAGTSPTYERTAERCTVQIGCAAPTACPMPVPACSAGYVLVEWRAAGGCASYACDPAFDPAP